MKKSDSRIYQIACLLTFLLYGIFALHFDIGLAQILTIIIFALSTQAILLRYFVVPVHSYKSALISSLSLCLLLRSSSLVILAAASAFTIASKFLIRFRGKHIFNPTNIGIVISVLLTESAWVSPGQWGSVAFIAGFVLCAGIFVSAHASRIDISFAFLLFYFSLLLARAWWLGDPWPIPLHQFQSGALLIFCFFMISDPMTTPNRRFARFLYAAIVSVITYVFRFYFYEPNALLYALALLSPLVPVFDWLFPGGAHRWLNPRSSIESSGQQIPQLQGA